MTPAKPCPKCRSGIVIYLWATAYGYRWYGCTRCGYMYRVPPWH